MRDTYHDELDTIGERVLEMIDLVDYAMQHATNALLTADLALADRVISGDDRVDALRVELEDRTFTLIAQQQPVATDLRVLISTIHLAGDLERMGDYAHHVAKTARKRHPAPAVPGEAHGVVAEMGRVGHSLVRKMAAAVESRDADLARAIEHEDDAMDDLQRRLFSLVLAPTWMRGREAALDVALVGRHYERYADHAVGVARRIVFVATGARSAR